MSEILTEERKRLIRAAVISQRKRVSLADAETWSRSIQETVVRFPPYLCASKVVLYNPFRGEVDTGLIRDDALRARKLVFYPNSDSSDSPEVVRFPSGETGTELRPIEARMDPSILLNGAIMIVPGLAFDAQGNRLGRGGGWYDRLLGATGGGAVPVALAYEFQIVDEVPVQQWDRAVNYIVTERRIIDCARERSNLAS